MVHGIIGDICKSYLFLNKNRITIFKIWNEIPNFFINQSLNLCMCIKTEEKMVRRLTRTLPKIELMYLIRQCFRHYDAIMTRYDLLLYYDLYTFHSYTYFIHKNHAVLILSQNHQNRTNY